MRLVTVFLLLCSLCQSLNVQTTNCTNNQGRETLAMQLANSLVSPDSGIVITGAEISGDCRQFGIFNNGSSVTAHLMDSGATKIPFIENGVTISTGFATYASRSENDYKGSDPSTPDSVVNLVCDSGTNTNENTPLLFSQYCNRSDYDCDFLCDSARLTFNFTLNQTSDLSVSYVFASEEYNYYAGYIRTELFGNTKYAHFNDMFAFFLDGENLALTDDGSVVSVQTINRGNPCTFDKVNDTYYSKPFGAKNVDQFVDNDIWFDPFDYTTECRAQWCPAESSTRATPGSYKTEYNGFTVTLRARKANVLKDVVHTMTFSIADDSDSIVNSQVFLQSGTFGTTRYGCTDPEALNFDSDALEDDESCAYISSATAFVSVPDRVYSKCPADVSFTSTKALKVDVKLCSENDNTCTSSLSSRNVSLGSYTDLTIPSVDSGTISSQVQGVFRLSSQDHASTSSSVVAIDSYVVVFPLSLSLSLFLLFLITTFLPPSFIPFQKKKKTSTTTKKQIQIRLQCHLNHNSNTRCNRVRMWYVRDHMGLTNTRSSIVVGVQCYDLRRFERSARIYDCNECHDW